jgi:hypothetical protein
MERAAGERFDISMPMPVATFLLHAAKLGLDPIP